MYEEEKSSIFYQVHEELHGEEEEEEVEPDGPGKDGAGQDIVDGWRHEDCYLGSSTGSRMTIAAIDLATGLEKKRSLARNEQPQQTTRTC